MKIHFVSNSLNQNTGFGNVTLYLAKGLKKLGYEVVTTGLQTAYLPQYNYGIECLPIQTDKTDEIGQFMNNIMMTDPDVVIYVGQMDVDLNNLTKVFPKTICYSPIEGMDIPSHMSNDMKQVIKNGGKIIAQCQYGQEEMKKVEIEAGCIYHGFNDQIFKPFKAQQNYCYYATDTGKENTDPRLLCQWGCYDCFTNVEKGCGYLQGCPYFKEETISFMKWIDEKPTQYDIEISNLQNEFNGKFVYLHVGQNFGLRKRQERLLKAYQILINESKQLKDRSIMHLHCMPISARGMNLLEIISKLKITENISFSYAPFRSNGWSEEALSILYNLTDVNVSASSSEGFGLPTIESLACGKSNVAPRCSSFIELIGDENDKNKRGLLARIESWHMIQDQSIRALVDEKNLALKMKEIYVRDDERKKMEKNGIEFVKNYSWDKICQQWNKVLQEMISK